MLAILFVTVFIDLVGFGIVVPFLAYYVESFGARAATVGLLMSTYSLAQFVFAPIWGRVSDRVGRRPILLVGLFGSVAGFIAFGLAGSLVTLFVGRAVMGIFGATIPTAQAAVADVTKPEDRARGMGLMGAAIGLGFIVGPALGGMLAQFSLPLSHRLGPGLPGDLFGRNPYALPSLAAAAIAALNLLAAAFFLPESLPENLRGTANERQSRLEVLRRGLADPALRTLVLLYFLFMFGFTMMESTLTLYLERRLGTPDHALLVKRVGYLFGFIGVVMVALQGGLVGRLSKRFGEARLLLAGLAAAAVSLALVPLAASWAGAYLVAFGLASGAGLSQPATAALISRAAPPTAQGSTLGFSQSAASLARVFAPIAAGALFQQVSPSSTYLVAAALAAAATLLAFRTRA